MAKLIEGEGFEQDLDKVLTVEEEEELQPSLDGLEILRNALVENWDIYGMPKPEEYGFLAARIVAQQAILAPSATKDIHYKILEKVPSTFGVEILKGVVGSGIVDSPMAQDEVLTTSMHQLAHTLPEVKKILFKLNEKQRTMGPYSLALAMGRSRFPVVQALYQEGISGETLDLTQARALSINTYMERNCTPSSRNLMAVSDTYQELFKDIRRGKAKILEAYQ